MERFLHNGLRPGLSAGHASSSSPTAARLVSILTAIGVEACIGGGGLRDADAADFLALLCDFFVRSWSTVLDDRVPFILVGRDVQTFRGLPVASSGGIKDSGAPFSVPDWFGEVIRLTFPCVAEHSFCNLAMGIAHGIRSVKTSTSFKLMVCCTFAQQKVE